MDKFSLKHITESPGTTMAGVAWLASTVSSSVQGGWPTTSAGWAGLAFNVGASVMMALARG